MLAPRISSLPNLVCLLTSFVLALGVIGCGSDDDDGDDGGGGQARDKQAEAAEKAFLSTMVPHHESALEMAEVAQEHGEDPFIKRLADGIRSTQMREIAEMRRIHTRRFGGTLRPDPEGHDRLGLTAEEAGMTHSPAMNAELASADPFDRAFVDEMVPHHRGAIRMADVVLEKTNDASIVRLARSIVATQKREIDQMNDFRTKEFGGPVPAGARHGRPSGDAPAGQPHDREHHPG